MLTRGFTPIAYKKRFAIGAHIDEEHLFWGFNINRNQSRFAKDGSLERNKC